ncbi:phage tail protein [Vreelandella alkaliphila]|uniref:phage tail protein n=1 Tax=Vreelandella alkaliphila TaxID=272774 RepID=UPI003FD8A5B5
MAEYYTTLTNIGADKVAAAMSGGPALHLAQMAAGDGGGASFYDQYDRDALKQRTHLVNQRWADDLNLVDQDPQNPAWVVTEGLIPTHVGGWYIREVGVFDIEGDLIAIGVYPETYKPVATAVEADLLIRSILEVGDAASVELKIDPSQVMATREWVIGAAVIPTVSDNDIDTLAEQYAGSSQPPSGILYYPVIENVKSLYNAGQSGKLNRRFIPSNTAEVQFSFGTNGPTYYPTKTASGFVLPIEEIQTSYLSAAIAPNPFVEHTRMGYNIDTFKYVGAGPAYGLLKGSITISMQVMAESEEKHRKRGVSSPLDPHIQLVLDMPNGANKGSNYRKLGLAQHVPVRTSERYRPNPFNSHFLSQNDSIVRTIGQLEELFARDPEAFEEEGVISMLSTETGYIGPNSIAEELTPPGSFNGVPNNAFTTEWFDCGDCSTFFLQSAGKTDSRRVQYKDKFGRIHYDNRSTKGWLPDEEESVLSMGPVILPAEAVYARVMCNYRRESANSEQIQLIRLPAKYDPFSGVWADYTFDISTFVEFQPNNVYRFLARFWEDDYMSLTSDRCIVQRANLTCMINTNDELAGWLKP